MFSGPMAARKQAFDSAFLLEPKGYALVTSV